MLKFFIENNMILSNQSDFKDGDSCSNQLLTIILEMKRSFGEGVDIRSVLLDNSKTYNKMWNDGIVFSLARYN